MASPILDWLLAAWIVFVAVVYFGGYFLPQIGALTGNFAALYAIMLIISAVGLWNRWRRPDGKNDSENDRE